MGNFIKICKASEVKAGCGKSVEIEGKAIGVFNVDGKYYAINDVCGHRGGPLAEGELDGTTVICPWHGSTFRFADGSIVRGPASTPEPCYQTRIQDGRIEVRAIT